MSYCFLFLSRYRVYCDPIRTSDVLDELTVDDSLPISVDDSLPILRGTYHKLQQKQGFSDCRHAI